MRLTEILKKKQRPTVSFEFFPARNAKAAERLDKAIDKLSALEPDFVSVTFGAGGTTRQGSFELASKLKNDKKQTVLAYFAGFGMGPEEIASVLDDYRDLEVENLLVVRGDRPEQDGDFKPHPQSLAHASDLLTFIAPRYSFCLGAAGYPEGHIEAKDKESDLEYLKLKAKTGAEFAIANYFYDNRYFLDFVARARGIGIQIPILAGIMPIYNVKMMENLAALCGATITDEVRRAIAALPQDDGDALNAFGIDFAFAQCAELIREGAAGLHIYTMDRAASAVGIIERLRAESLI